MDVDLNGTNDFTGNGRDRQDLGGRNASRRHFDPVTTDCRQFHIPKTAATDCPQSFTPSKTAREQAVGLLSSTGCGAEGNRTPGLDCAIVALYQLSYSPVCGGHSSGGRRRSGTPNRAGESGARSRWIRRLGTRRCPAATSGARSHAAAPSGSSRHRATGTSAPMRTSSHSTWSSQRGTAIRGMPSSRGTARSYDDGGSRPGG